MLLCLMDKVLELLIMEKWSQNGRLRGTFGQKKAEKNKACETSFSEAFFLCTNYNFFPEREHSHAPSRYDQLGQPEKSQSTLNLPLLYAIIFRKSM
jgi:hypothetical protein